MKPARLGQLADGIFAIVMTLLVLELKTPVISRELSGIEIFRILGSLDSIFLAYVLSFTMLFTYWRAHHYIASVLSKTIDHRFLNINAAFFLFVALVPFSARLLGDYGYSAVAVFVYALNVILIGLTLYRMRQYALKAETIENELPTRTELHHGTIRIMFPVFIAVIAVLVSLASPRVSILLFTLAVLFNFSAGSTRATVWVLRKFRFHG